MSEGHVEDEPCNVTDNLVAEPITHRPACCDARTGRNHREHRVEEVTDGGAGEVGMVSWGGCHG